MLKIQIIISRLLLTILFLSFIPSSTLGQIYQTKLLTNLEPADYYTTDLSYLDSNQNLIITMHDVNEEVVICKYNNQGVLLQAKHTNFAVVYPNMINIKEDSSQRYLWSYDEGLVLDLDNNLDTLNVLQFETFVTTLSYTTDNGLLCSVISSWDSYDSLDGGNIGYFEQFSGSRVVKLDQNGFFQWSRLITSNRDTIVTDWNTSVELSNYDDVDGESRIHGMLIASNNDIILSGVLMFPGNNEKPFFVRLDSNGNLLEYRVLTFSNYTENIYTSALTHGHSELFPVPSGYIMVMGIESDGGSALILNVDQNFNPIWNARVYGSLRNAEKRDNSLILTIESSNIYSRINFNPSTGTVISTNSYYYSVPYGKTIGHYKTGGNESIFHVHGAALPIYGFTQMMDTTANCIIMDTAFIPVIILNSIMNDTIVPLYISPGNSYQNLYPFDYHASVSSFNYYSDLTIDDSILCELIDLSVLTETDSPSEVIMFPNPLIDELNFIIDETHVGSPFRVIDVSGKIIYKGIIYSSSPSYDLSFVPSGLYYIKISGISTIYKVVKN